jgi:hypothetical protein
VLKQTKPDKKTEKKKKTLDNAPENMGRYNLLRHSLQTSSTVSEKAALLCANYIPICCCICQLCDKKDKTYFRITKGIVLFLLGCIEFV